MSVYTDTTTVTVHENENATLPCNFPAGKKVLVILWTFGRKQIYKNVAGREYKYVHRKKHYTLIGGASIFLYGADRHDHGIYTCTIAFYDGTKLQQGVNLIVNCKYYRFSY